CGLQAVADLHDVSRLSTVWSMMDRIAGRNARKRMASLNDGPSVSQGQLRSEARKSYGKGFCNGV
ncbi:MAG: hypothetical protein ABF562_05990, partial [Gluconobacter japonicus]|uniref:hypothetical protein n=1 Tax=Gluconobacter japonicus TaxID=376620 RepID=UPI0039E88276